MTTVLERDPPPEPRRCALESCGRELVPGEVYLAVDGNLYHAVQCALIARGIIRGKPHQDTEA